jgi:hypothetical protein
MRPGSETDSSTPVHREPSWEPFPVDDGGRPWTPVDSKARRAGAHGLAWTPLDTAWRSTDQEVGGSSPSGRAAETVVAQQIRLAADQWTF